MRKYLTHNKEVFFVFCLVALSVAAHYYVLFQYASNIPKIDDYTDIFRFINRYRDATGWYEKLVLIFEQHTSHRTAFSRLIYTIMYGLFGQINLKILILIGDLSTLGIIYLFSEAFRKKESHLYFGAFSAIFLLNLQSWEGMLWAMTALSNYCVVFFALASISALVSERKGCFPWAVALAFLSSFSQGNGVFIWLIGFVYLVIDGRGRGLGRVSIWAIFASISMTFYFYNYEFMSAPAIGGEHVSIVEMLRRVFFWFITFMGSCWVFESGNTQLAAMIGFFIAVCAIPAFMFLRKRAPALGYFIIFVLMSGAIASYSRSSWLNDSFALSSRYRIYSVYLSAVIFLAAYLYLEEKAVFRNATKIVLMMVALAHTTVSYAASFYPMRIAQRDYEDAMRHWLITGRDEILNSRLAPLISKFAREALDSAAWDPRSLFHDSLYFSDRVGAMDCGREKFKAEVQVVLTRNPEAIVGEMVIGDASFFRGKIRRIVVCKQRVAYLGDFVEQSRTADGSQLFHYLKADPLESADFMVLEYSPGVYLKGNLAVGNE